MNVGYLFTILRTLKMPGLLPLIKDWQSFVRLHFLYAAIQSGLLAGLRKPSSREELLRNLHVDRPEILDALLDVGLSLKELGYDGERYRLRGKRSLALSEDDGDILSAMIEANITYYGSVYRHAADRMHGAPLGDDLQRIGDVVARFSKISEPFIREFIKEGVAGKESIRVLDIGCGSGVILKSIYEINHATSGIGIDIDKSAVKQARENLRLWNLSDRFKIIAGDICALRAEIEGPFDFVTLFNLLYYLPAGQRRALLRHIRTLLPPGGTLAIAMTFDSGGKDLAAANLNMVNVSLKGLTALPDLHELIAQLKESGFGTISTRKLIPASTFYGITARVS